MYVLHSGRLGLVTWPRVPTFNTCVHASWFGLMRFSSEDGWCFFFFFFWLSTHTYSPSDVPCFQIYNKMNCGKRYGCLLLLNLNGLFTDAIFIVPIHVGWFANGKTIRVRSSLFIYPVSCTRDRQRLIVSDTSGSSSEVIYHISWKPDVHCRVHKSPPMFPVPKTTKFQL
jgi:hypothetical protein